MKKILHNITGKWILVVAILTSLLLTACGTDESGSLIEHQTASHGVSVETEYVTMWYPKEYEGKLTSKEVVQDGVSVVIFNAMVGEEDRELFRIYFNDESMGALSGYIIRGTEEIPVSYYVDEYEEDIFITEAMKADYYSLLDAFEAVMNSIYQSPQFSADKREISVADRTESLKYWKVTIPENVYWEEFESEVVYRVDFYGMVDDVRVDLYSVGFGEMEEDYSIGSYLVDGVEREIQVRIYDIPDEDEMEESEANTFYRMFESVNAVVEAIEAEA